MMWVREVGRYFMQQSKCHFDVKRCLVEDEGNIVTLKNPANSRWVVVLGIADIY
jgi:hypothetical protein